MSAVRAEQVRERLDDVVRAMKDNGTWDVPRPPDEAFSDMGAFGTRSMAFAQWLRWVFAPNVEALIAAGGPFPRSSAVGVQAMREGDTDPLIAALCPSLQRFDALFVAGSSPPPPATAAGPARPPATCAASTRCRRGVR